MPVAKIAPMTVLALLLGGGMALAQDMPSPEDLAQAKTNYVDFCASCHATNGSGDLGPKLSGSAKLADGAFVMQQIAKGSGEMPGFADVLSQTEMLGIANYIRNNLGNSYGYLKEEDIAKADP